ncbi:hypothetical protein EKN07_03505 [Actinobaculum sp. 352]|nr:hypothetical protein DDD63_02400 [Actinobaculum sp. 313]RTE50285.1 hypothetical protein EKN07_03505 [Actinobaculum sp. 352]
MRNHRRRYGRPRAVGSEGRCPRLALAIVPLVLVLLFSGCGSGQRGDDMFIQDNGSKPFAERVDLATAQEQLLGAAARMRERIDAEFGPFKWDRIDGPTRSSCRDGNDRGGDAVNVQGMVPNSGLSDEDFEVAMQIVREEAAVYGFTYEVDVSDEVVFWVNLFNEEDGGHVSVIMNRENRGFSIGYTTGCRPEARR